MKTVPVYEQMYVDGKPSGLYAHQGELRQKRFFKASRPSPLKTLAQLRSAALMPDYPDRWRCQLCLSPMPTELDAAGNHLPCENCGWMLDERAGEQVKGDFMTTYTAAPSTFDAVVQRQYATTHHLPLPPAPRAQTAVLTVARRAHTTVAHRGTLTQALHVQRTLGHQAPDLYAKLRTHEVQPCARCGKPDSRQCACPPMPPKTLDLILQKQGERLKQMEQAAISAGLAPLIKTTGMSSSGTP